MTSSTDFGLDIGILESEVNYDPNAGGTDKQHHVLKLGTTGVTDVAAISDVAYGVLQNNPRLGQAATMRFFGMTKIVIGAACVFGDDMYLTATGRVVPLAAAGAGARYIGTALEAGAADGDKIRLQLAPLHANTAVKP